MSVNAPVATVSMLANPGISVYNVLYQVVVTGVTTSVILGNSGASSLTMKKSDRNKLKPGNLVIIYWEDIVEDINDDFKKLETATCESVGWVEGTKEKNTILSIHTSTSRYTDKGHEDVGTSSLIPVDCIFKVDLVRRK